MFLNGSEKDEFIGPAIMTPGSHCSSQWRNTHTRARAHAHAHTHTRAHAHARTHTGARAQTRGNGECVCEVGVKTGLGREAAHLRPNGQERLGEWLDGTRALGHAHRAAQHTHPSKTSSRHARTFPVAWPRSVTSCRRCPPRSSPKRAKESKHAMRSAVRAALPTCSVSVARSKVYARTHARTHPRAGGSGCLVLTGADTLTPV